MGCIGYITQVPRANVLIKIGERSSGKIDITQISNSRGHNVLHIFIIQHHFV